MSAKGKPREIYDEFYDDDSPCADDESVIEIKRGDKVACERMAGGRLNVKLQGKSVPGKKKKATRREAEDNLHEAILDAVDTKRKTDKIRCDSKSTECKDGRCYTSYTIDERRVQCRLAKRKGTTIWLCTYSGQVNHSCICVT